MKLEFDYDDLWQQYFQAARSRKATFYMYWDGKVVTDDWLYLHQSDEVRALCKLCAKSYCDGLALFPEQEWSRLYFEDIKDAARKDDLGMMEVLFDVFSHCRIVVPLEFDEFLLSYFISFFKRITDVYEIIRVQSLFERVISNSEQDLDIYSSMIDEIFSMNKNPEWFAEFYWGVSKLLYRAPKSQETLLAMRKGLMGTGPKIKREIERIIAYTYENRREILVVDVQAGKEHITTLMYFQDGIKPRADMVLSNNEVICRIDDFEEIDNGQIYRCWVTVIKGELTTISRRFEVQI